MCRFNMEVQSAITKKEKILIIFTIIMVTVVFTGIGWAFFTVNNPEGSTAQIISDTGRMLITYDDGTDSILPVTNIQPSNTILVNKTFSLKGTNTTVGMSESDGLTMPYKVGVQYTSGFSDGMLHYYIKEVEEKSDADVTANYVITPDEDKTDDDYKNQTVPGNDAYTGYVHGTFKKGNNKYTEMVTGEFPASLNDKTITFNLIIQFPDNNENQDSEKGKTFNGKIVINYEPKYISTYLTKLDKTENGLEVDDTSDENLRYVGASPKNYIIFNNETWRIIGVFNNITTIDEQGNEKTESLVKIIRNDSLGNYSWDSSSADKNGGYGVNEWSQADLMTELNTDYINSSLTSGTTYWYNGSNNAKNGTYDYSKNIKSSSIDKIAKVRWNTNRAVYGASALNSYNQERSTTLISTPSDNVPRTNTWDGKIALMYPSDYGSASTDTVCRSELSSDCGNENWLFNSAYQWTLSPSSSDTSIVFSVGPIPAMGLGGYGVSGTYGVRPVLFLKSDVVIAGGTGTESDPYKLKASGPFNNDSWETIANNVKNGTASLYNVGDEKEIEIDGKSYTVRIANNSKPEECSGDDFSETACGFVVEFVDIVETRAMNTNATNVGGWPASEMRTYVNGEFYKNLPEELRNVIIDTEVISGHGNTDNETNFFSTDKIYLLSTHEIWEEDGTTNQLLTFDTAYNVTRQLDYYKFNGVTTSKNYLRSIKQYNNSNYNWWLRSAISKSDKGFLLVSSNTGKRAVNNASNINGIAPAFRIG